MTVSIIIPIYNVEPYIEECLRSVARQTVTEHIECILVDDCGTDHSVELAEQFMNDYEGTIVFHFLHHSHNRGLSAARNTGIKASKGEYLYFMDSDDELSSTCIEQLLSIAKETDADMVQGSYDASSSLLRNFSKSLPSFIGDCQFIKRLMLDYDRFPVMAQNRLVKRRLIVDRGLYFKEGIIHEDNHWTFFLSKHLHSLAICPEPTYIYKENPNSITQKPNKQKEALAFSTFITDFCACLDDVQRGSQKTLILSNLLTLLRSGFYNSPQERDQFVALVASIQNWYEKMFFCLFTNTYKHRNLCVLFYKILIRLYRLEDKQSFAKLRPLLPTRLHNYLYWNLNPWWRKHVILPKIRGGEKMRTDTSVFASNCIGGCMLHDMGMRFCSPFVNLWLFPKDFIKFCQDVPHYLSADLKFLSAEEIQRLHGLSLNYPVALLDDITIFFQHYHSQEEAETKWTERCKRVNLSNIRCILVERDGCSYEDLVQFSQLPYPTAALLHLPVVGITNTSYIHGFEKADELGNIMEFRLRQCFGRMYYDDFDFIKFLS